MNNVAKFYELYDEDSRLKTNNSRKIEFITTTSYLDKYINETDKILEIGAGTGIYSFYYAERGNEVTATDITPKHVNIINCRLKERNNLRMVAKVADALNLHEFERNSFEIVLCLGPMYHLITKEDQEKCISECLRVLKPGGLLAIAYIPRYSVYPYLVKSDRKFLNENWVERIVNKGLTSSLEEDCFWTDAYFHVPNEIEKLMKSYETDKVQHIATDGIGPLMNHIIDKITDEEFEVWLKYHFKTCSEPSILGLSNHALFLCRKR